MNIENIINENVEQVDINNLDLPENMQTIEPQNININTEAGAGTGTDEKFNKEATKLSLEQLSGMIIGAFDVVHKMAWEKIEPNFDASLTHDEINVIDEPLKLVLKSYDIEVTPPIALLIAVAGVEVGKFMQLKFFKAQMQIMQNTTSEYSEVEEPNQTEENE